MIYAVAILVALYAASRVNWKKWYYRHDIQFPAGPKRPDLYWGYYGCLDEQVAETRGTVNLHMESQFNGIDKAIKNILDAGVDCMLDVSIQVFTDPVKGQYRAERPDAEQRLRDFFKLLQERGALRFVKVIYPVDEPNNTVGEEIELVRAIGTIKRVAAEFPELDGHKLAVIYAADKPFIGQSMYDWIGFDDYDMKSSLMLGKKYQALKASLLPHQRTIIVPGAAYGQDPVPLVNYAQTHSEVAVVLCFLWLDNTNGDVGALGARSNGMGPAYLAAGKSVIQ